MDRELHNFKLLYVEDEEESRREMTRFLKRRFSRVICASHGREGLEKYRDFQPDLIITDLIMPEMDGMEMVSEIRKQSSTCPILITSALEDLDSVLKTVELGIVKYILKPIDTNDLSETLDRIAVRLQGEKAPLLRFGASIKRELELSLRSAVSSFLKKHSGKGPREVSVFLGNDTLEITASGTLTPFEETLLNGEDHRLIVEQNRKLFYKVSAADLESEVVQVLACPVKLVESQINIPDRRDRLIFRYRERL